MITVISGTNRINSECLQFAKAYTHILAGLTDEEVELLALEEVPHDWFQPGMYEAGQMSPTLVDIQDRLLVPASRFVILAPEYNGSYPGALKLLLDACSVRKYKETFQGKKAALVGIASGRAGNLMGMNQLTTVLHHLGIIVLPFRLPLSRIGEMLNGNGKITDEETLKGMARQARELLLL